MKLTKFVLCALALSAPLYAAEPVVVMKHGDTVITQDDVLRFVDFVVPPQKRAQLMGDEKRLRDLVAQLYVTRKLVELNRDMPLTEDEQWRVANLRERELARIYMARVVDAAEKPDFVKRAQEVYQANLKRYEVPEQVHVEHILIDAKERSDEEAQQRAQEVLAKVKKGDVAFADLAKEYSDDPSAQGNGGDLGFFGRGRMVGPFEDAAFAMKKQGELSAPVKTPFGYHILRFVERKEARTRPFDEVKAELIAAEERKFSDETAMKEYNRIGNLEGMEVNQDAITSLVKPIDMNALVKQKAPGK
jgi:peptidyl-prolyl cis-trans isomerase C